MFTAEERASLWISIGVGATGTAVAEERVVVADDDLAAPFPPSAESTEFYVRTGFQSMIAAPITGDAGPMGVLEVYSTARDAFGDTDASLVGALASQAAIAITNARLIEELAPPRARRCPGRRTPSGRCARSPSRVSATHDQEEILQAVIDASVRLLGAAGAMIDLLSATRAWPTRGRAAIRPIARPPHLDLLSTVGSTPDAGVSGRSMQTHQVEWTGAYLEDERFTHTDERDAFVRASRASSRSSPRRSSTATSSSGRSRSTATDRTPSASEDAALLAALADQAAVAIANARLIEELERSRAESRPARRLGTDAARDRRARVGRSSSPTRSSSRSSTRRPGCSNPTAPGSTCTTAEQDTLRWSYAAGRRRCRRSPTGRRRAGSSPGRRSPGPRSPSRRAVRTDDYLSDDRFVHDDAAHAFVTSTRASARSSPSRWRAMLRCLATRRRSGRCRSSRGTSPPTTMRTARS